MAASVYSRTLRKAAELIGGNPKLCRHLKVPSDALANWIADKEKPPLAVFLRAVDLVLTESHAVPGSDPDDPSSPRDASADSTRTSF